MGLRKHPYASASFPTVTFDNENKSTPYKAFIADVVVDLIMAAFNMSNIL